MKGFKHKNTYFLVIGLCLYVFINAHGQESMSFPKSNDIGLNMTSLLTSFLGNTNNDVSPESFPFVFKFNRKNHAYRIGFGVALANSDNNLKDVEQLIFNNYSINSRFGVEKKKYLGHKIAFFYGIDLIGQFGKEENTVSNEVDISKIFEKSFGFGLGPIFGFEYYLNQKLYFGVEGSFYTLYNYTNRTEEFQFNPAINAQKTLIRWNSQIAAPSKLYVMVRF